MKIVPFSSYFISSNKMTRNTFAGVKFFETEKRRREKNNFIYGEERGERVNQRSKLIPFLLQPCFYKLDGDVIIGRKLFLIS